MEEEQCSENPLQSAKIGEVWTQEQTIISWHLFAGHVFGCRLLKRRKTDIVFMNDNLNYIVG